MAEIPEKKRREIELVAGFINSDVWRWLKANLESQRDQLNELVADPRISDSQRALVAGQIGVIVGILKAPEKISRVAEAAEKQVRDSYGKRAAPMIHPD